MAAVQVKVAPELVAEDPLMSTYAELPVLGQVTVTPMERLTVEIVLWLSHVGLTPEAMVAFALNGPRSGPPAELSKL